MLGEKDVGEEHAGDGAGNGERGGHAGAPRDGNDDASESHHIEETLEDNDNANNEEEERPPALTTCDVATLPMGIESYDAVGNPEIQPISPQEQAENPQELRV